LSLSLSRILSLASIFVAVLQWDSEELHNVELNPSGGVEMLEPAVRAAFNVPADKCCKLYYLTDPQHPKQSKRYMMQRVGRDSGHASMLPMVISISIFTSLLALLQVHQIRSLPGFELIRE
ncbi:MAG: hypothetical protein Q7T57_05150, partial [Dehalococcoidales bacterium]|nr:hypothetical protein [Dehalococcoidales bacterium]